MITDIFLGQIEGIVIKKCQKINEHNAQSRECNLSSAQKLSLIVCDSCNDIQRWEPRSEAIE